MITQFTQIKYEDITFDPPLPQNIKKIIYKDTQNKQFRSYGSRIEPALFFIIIEYLSQNKKSNHLSNILQILRNNPYYINTNHAHLIYLYRTTMYRLSKLMARLNSTQYSLYDEVFKEFYQSIHGTLDAFSLAFTKILSVHQNLNKLFQQFEINLAITYMDEQSNTYNQLGTPNSNLNTVILIKTQTDIYACINHNPIPNYDNLNTSIISQKSALSSISSFNSFKSTISNKIYKLCSVCQNSPDTLTNLFCQHKYCFFCLKQYFKYADTSQTSYFCPKKGCSAKIIRSLLQNPSQIIQNSRIIESFSFTSASKKNQMNEEKQTKETIPLAQNISKTEYQPQKNIHNFCSACLFQCEYDNQTQISYQNCQKHIICAVCHLLKDNQCILCLQ